MGELKIENLHVEVDGNEILRGVDLEVNSGELMALLGPNGHGKSTLLAAIMGNPRYKVTEGKILFNGEDVLSMSVDERSRKGIFLAFQNPSEIPGVVSADFYKAALNARSEKKIPLFKYFKDLETACKEVGIPFEMVNRNINDGFSGGEKKRNEILQMILLNPKLAMLDEIDSGLDVDAINTVSEAINKQKEKDTAFLVISHYARLFVLVKPKKTAVMINGKIVVQGGPELFERIDKEGYEWIKTELGIDIEKKDEGQNKVSLGVCGVKETVNDAKDR
jgi:Fe-S cluster assembly ATP-binding protein